jgi:transposase
MEYGAIDLHRRRSQFRIVAEDGTIMKDGKCETTRAEFTRVFGGRARMRVLVESSTDSEWVAQHLESLGHEVIVADPSYAAMYGSRLRCVKTDRRDTVALTEACRLGIYRRAHRVSAGRRADRQQLRIRRHVIAMRTKGINLVRAILRQDGYRLGSGAPEQIEPRLERLTLPRGLQAILAPMRTWLAALNRLIAAGDAATAARAAADADATLLMTAPGVGPVVALTFEAVLDSPARFAGDAARASAFIGLVPSEDSSADRHRKGHITKTGSRELRSVLVQASWTIWRGRSPAGAQLRAWAQA